MLTWRIENVGGNFDRNTVREVMYKAFAIWTKHANIRFRETTAVNADIIVKFVRQCHYSDDYYCFDGKGGTLAHAFYPFPGQGKCSPSGIATTIPSIYICEEKLWVSNIKSSNKRGCCIKDFGV